MLDGVLSNGAASANASAPTDAQVAGAACVCEAAGTSAVHDAALQCLQQAQCAQFASAVDGALTTICKGASCVALWTMLSCWRAGNSKAKDVADGPNGAQRVVAGGVGLVLAAAIAALAL